MEKTKRRNSAQKLPGLRAARGARGLTQAGLAEASGVSRFTINKLEFGDRGSYAPTVHALASVLDVPATVLLEEPGEELEALVAHDRDTALLESGEAEMLSWEESRRRRTASS